MNSLWTPGGDHEIPRDPGRAANTSSPAGDPSLDDAVAAALPDGITLADLTPEQRAQAEEMVKEMASARQRLLEAPAASVVANHAMGLYELAALHLSEQEPNFTEARLAIDALSALTEKLMGRLGEAEPTLNEALDQLRMVCGRLQNQPDAEAAN